MLTGRLPSPKTVRRTRSVALGYGLLGLMYVAITAMLLASAWSGSATRLWSDIMLAGSTFRLLLALVVVHGVLCGLSLVFATCGVTTRRVAVGLATLLAGFACANGALTTVKWLRGGLGEELPTLIVPTHLLAAASYGLLAWLLWRAHVGLADSSNDVG